MVARDISYIYIYVFLQQKQNSGYNMAHPCKSRGATFKKNWGTSISPRTTNGVDFSNPKTLGLFCSHKEWGGGYPQQKAPD